MYFDAKELIVFCANKKITVEQFLLCYLTHKEMFPLIYKYSREVRPFPKSLVQDLEKKKFLINLNKDGEGFPDNLIITEDFIDDLKFLLGDEADEFWEAFPIEVAVGGKAFNGKTMSREDLEAIYYRKLSKSKTTHEDVMKALEEQVDNQTVGMGLKKWFETETVEKRRQHNRHHE